MSEFTKELECKNCEFKCTIIHNDEDAMFAGLWYCPACGDEIEDENEDEDFFFDEEDEDEHE